MRHVVMGNGPAEVWSVVRAEWGSGWRSRGGGYTTVDVGWSSAREGAVRCSVGVAAAWAARKQAQLVYSAAAVVEEAGNSEVAPAGVVPVEVVGLGYWTQGTGRGSAAVAWPGTGLERRPVRHRTQGSLNTGKSTDRTGQGREPQVSQGTTSPPPSSSSWRVEGRWGSVGGW